MIVGSVVAEYFSTRELSCKSFNGIPDMLLLTLETSCGTHEVVASELPGIVTCVPSSMDEKDWIALLLLVVFEFGTLFDCGTKIPLTLITGVLVPTLWKTSVKGKLWNYLYVVY